MIPVTGVSGITWTSPEITKTAGIPKGSSLQQTTFVDVKATGVNATSTLKVQIWIDGVLKKEVITTGQDLNAEARYEMYFTAN